MPNKYGQAVDIRGLGLTREYGLARCPVCKAEMNAPFPFRRHMNTHVSRKDITEQQRSEIMKDRQWLIKETPGLG